MNSSPRKSRAYAALKRAANRFAWPFAIGSVGFMVLETKYDFTNNSVNAAGIIFGTLMAGSFIGDVVHYYRNKALVDAAQYELDKGPDVFYGRRHDERFYVNKGILYGTAGATAALLIVGGAYFMQHINKQDLRNNFRHSFETLSPRVPAQGPVANYMYVARASNG